MNAQEYVELREGRDARVKRVQDGWLVTCPAHDDGNPSLHVSEGRDGCVLLDCKASCQTGDVIAADGIDWGDLFPNGGESNGRVEVAAYPYPDERGEVLFEVVRFHPKDFRQRRPDGHGGWIWKLADTRRVLYRLPNVIEAVQTGVPVYVVEGEKDVHALERVGVVATCNPMGAGKWRREYADSLRGASVVVVADRDDAGRKHAQAVARSLRGVAASVKVVEPADGKDADDHLRAGRTVEEFVELSGDAPLGASRLVDMAAAIRDAGHALPYRVWPLAVDGMVTMLVGRRGEHKSWASMFACASVQSGAPLAGLHCPQGPALYLDVENGPRLLARRFVKAGLDPDAFLVADGTGLHLPADIDEVAALVRSTGAKLLILDSLRRLASGMREDKSDDAAPVMAAIAEMGRATNCAVIVIHHRSTKPNAADVRGSSVLEDQADIVFNLERVARDPEGRTRRRLRCSKMRPDAEPAPVWLSFEIVAGFMVVKPAEPFERGSDDDDGSEPTAEERLADRIRALAGQVVCEEPGWTPARLAAAVGSEPTNGTFKRALQLLLDGGEWVAKGATRARRLRPADLGHSVQPLREGPNGPNQTPLPEVDSEPVEDPDQERAERLLERLGDGVELAGEGGAAT